MIAPVTVRPRPAPPQDRRLRGAQSDGHAKAALVVVALCYVGAQLASMDFSRALSWDEAVYLSQVRPDVEALGFPAHRARGITWLVAPVAVWSTSTEAVRLYLAVLSGPALWAAFLPWVRITRWAAPVAACAYGFSWFVLVSQTELHPNPLAALAAVAAVGWFVCAVDDGGPRAVLVALAAAVAVVGLLRPTESVFLCLGLVPGLIGATRRRVGRTAGALLSGGFVGLLPWAVEAVVGFGGPLERLRHMTEATTQAAPAAPAWRQYLSLLTTDLAGPLTSPSISGWAIGAIAVLIACCGAGWISAVRSGRLRIAVALTSSSLALLLPYLFANPHAHLRFIFPAYGVALVLAALGAVAVVQRAWPVRHSSTVTAVGLVLLITATSAWVVVQIVVARGMSVELSAEREPFRRIGTLVADRADGRPCAVASDEGWPQIAFYSGCTGGPLVPGDISERALLASSAYDRVYAITATMLPEDADVATWPTQPIEDLPGWMLYRRPDGGGGEDPGTDP